jgi:hypothetical protein
MYNDGALAGADDADLVEIVGAVGPTNIVILS